MIEGPIEKIYRKEIVTAIRAIKSGKAAEPCEVCGEISYRGNVGSGAMTEPN